MNANPNIDVEIKPCTPSRPSAGDLAGFRETLLRVGAIADSDANPAGPPQGQGQGQDGESQAVLMGVLSSACMKHTDEETLLREPSVALGTRRAPRFRPTPAPVGPRVNREPGGSSVVGGYRWFAGTPRAVTIRSPNTGTCCTTPPGMGASTSCSMPPRSHVLWWCSLHQSNIYRYTPDTYLGVRVVLACL